MLTFKKYWSLIVVLIILLPLGIILPHVFQAGEAWGEWSVNTVKQQTGLEPAGMKNDAGIYKAPIHDYNQGLANQSLFTRSMHYIISGVIGTGIILLITFGATKIVSKKSE